jgi:S1-C subfamily serine protease
MPRSPIAAAFLLMLAAVAHADDAITPEVVQAVKQATVYIQIESTTGGKSGSGFVVSADGGTCLIATNHHVAAKRAVGAPAIKVVFDSGTKTERSYSAEIIASDSDRDLAVLNVTGVKDAPKPVALHRSSDTDRDDGGLFVWLSLWTGSLDWQEIASHHRRQGVGF